jgi:hypothetical protein
VMNENDRRQQPRRLLVCKYISWVFPLVGYVVCLVATNDVMAE